MWTLTYPSGDSVDSGCSVQLGEVGWFVGWFTRVRRK